jgi:hypothetical protein
MRLLRQSALFLITLALAISAIATQQSPTGKPTSAQKQPDVAVQMVQRPTYDQGIYLPTYADGQSTCAAIMSYNFSPGDNPQLQSVTTCTPAKPNSIYRTDDENRKPPPAPALLMISSPQSVPKAKGTSDR